MGVQSHSGAEGKHATSPRASKFRSENLVEREHAQSLVITLEQGYPRNGSFCGSLCFHLRKNRKYAEQFLGEGGFKEKKKNPSPSPPSLVAHPPLRKECDNNTDTHTCTLRWREDTLIPGGVAVLRGFAVSRTCRSADREAADTQVELQVSACPAPANQKHPATSAGSQCKLTCL